MALALAKVTSGDDAFLVLALQSIKFGIKISHDSLEVGFYLIPRWNLFGIEVN